MSSFDRSQPWSKEWRLCRRGCFDEQEERKKKGFVGIHLYGEVTLAVQSEMGVMSFGESKSVLSFFFFFLFFFHHLVVLVLSYGSAGGT
jgi:hypothetical protein